MTLRVRIAALASVSVALAVLGVALGLYFAVRSDLRGEIDRSLRERAQTFAGSRAAGGPPPGGPPDGRPPPGWRWGRVPADGAAGPVWRGGGVRAVHLARAVRTQVPGGQSATSRIAPTTLDEADRAAGQRQRADG